MAKVKIKNQKSLNSAKQKLHGNVSLSKTKSGVVAKKWPLKKSKKLGNKIYKIQKEIISTKILDDLGVRDASTGTLINLNVNTNKKVLADVKQTPYFHQGNFVLYNGDSLSLLKDLQPNSVDMIFADPPYNLSNGGFSVHAGKMVSVNKGDWDKSKGFNDDYAFHYNWLEACRRVLKPGGTLWVSGTYHSIYQCGYALQALGYHILNDISWFKPNASPNLSCRFFTASHETIIWARKDKKAKHTFNYDWMKNKEWPNDFFKNEGKQMRSVWHIPDSESIWSIGTPKKEEKIFGKHPTQKPLDLLLRIILASTNKGDVVLDPFTGSSTTGIAAAMNDRKFVGIDSEKEYLDLSKKRFEELKRNNIKTI